LGNQCDWYGWEPGTDSSLRANWRPMDSGASAGAGASWDLAEQQQYLDSLPNDYFQQRSSYSTRTTGIPGAGLLPRPGWGDQYHGQRNWYSEDDHYGQREWWYSGDEYKSWNIDRREPGYYCQGESLQPTSWTGFGQEQYLNNSDMLKTLDRLQTNMSRFERSELTPTIRWGREKIIPKRLQDASHNSKRGRNKLFRGLKAAGKSIKESFQEQVVKVKNLVKGKSKGKSFSEVLSNEGVDVGLTLDCYLIEAGEVEKVQREKEENLEEDLLLWEEGWGRDFRLKTAGGEEEEDLRSPNWEDVKEATTDTAKKKLAMTKFSNPVSSDPANCLTFHGFKTKSSKAMSGSFSICEGRRIPLSGAKRKVLDLSNPLLPLKLVKMSDLSKVMQSKCAEHLVESHGVGPLKSLEENCEDQLHLPNEAVKEFFNISTSLRQALQENDNFLQYYSNRKGAYVTQDAAVEALDLVEMSAFSKAVYQTGAVQTKSV